MVYVVYTSHSRGFGFEASMMAVQTVILDLLFDRPRETDVLPVLRVWTFQIPMALESAILSKKC